MMGLGTFGIGGSSSPSSNLSALAPPFSVDRSNSKPNANPLGNFSEPPYALPFHSSFPNWQYSHRPSAAGPDFYPNHGSEVDSIRTTCLPATDIPNPTFSAALDPNFTAASNSFTFLQYSNEVPSKHVGDKPFYPSFASPAIDDDVPLVALNETSYDLLSTTRAPLDGPIQVDYSELGYMPQWHGSWNRLSDLEQGKRVGLDGSFCSEEKNIASPYVYSNYTKQVVSLARKQTTEQLVLGVIESMPSNCFTTTSARITSPIKWIRNLGHELFKQGVDVLSPHYRHFDAEDASAVSSRKYVDVFGSESQIVSPSKGKLHDKVQNPRFISGDSSRTSISGSSTIPQSHEQGPFPKPAANFWNHQVSYDPSYDKCFQPLESSSTDFLSLKKSAAPLVIRPPPSVGTGSTMPNAASSEKKAGKVVVNNRKGSGFHDSLKEPHLHVQRTNHFFVASSCSGKEEMENKPVAKDVMDYISKGGMEFQHPNANGPDGFTLANDSAQKAFSSVEDSPDGLDNGTSVDSPCWKGAPASSFSLPEVAEACNGLNLQQTQGFPPSIFDSVKAYEENGYVELGSLLCPEKISSDDVKAGFNNPKLSSNKGFQFYNDVDKPRKEYGLPNDSKSCLDSKPAHTKELGLEKREVTSETDFKFYAGWNTSDASEDVSVPLQCMESTSRVPSSAEIDHKLAKLDAMESSPKMNVQMMVNTIRHLSELLLFYWSNDVSAGSQKDHEAIKHAINNLDACVSKKIPHMTPTRESRFPQHGISRGHDHHKGVTPARSTVTKAANASSNGRLDHHHMYEGKRNNSSSGKKVEKGLDFVTLMEDADSMKDDKIVQAIKELLKEDFIGEEETQSVTLLYKNLWLEAEAALCSISYKARFNRMKIEMEKRKSDNVKDVETLEAVEKVPNFKVSPDPYMTGKVTPEAKDNPMSDISIEDSSISTMTKIVDDVETSVMARFDILKRRGQSSNPVNALEQQPTEVVDAGFADNRKHFTIVGDLSEPGSLNVSGEFCVNSGGNSKIDEFGPYISSNYIGSSDDQVIGSGRKKTMGSGTISGWYDSSSSDWEHVLKDEFAGQN